MIDVAIVTPPDLIVDVSTCEDLKRDVKVQPFFGMSRVERQWIELRVTIAGAYFI